MDHAGEGPLFHLLGQDARHHRIGVAGVHDHRQVRSFVRRAAAIWARKEALLLIARGLCS